MPVTEFAKDLDNLTITITADFAASPERVWEVYANPRQMEKIWGPPDCPATIVEHSLTPGGRVHYFMTGPEGEKYPGGWEVIAVDEPHSFEFTDLFMDQDFNPVPDMPVSHNVYRLEAHGDGTRLVSTTTYGSANDLQQVLDMGMEEGATLAINQIDAFLAGQPAG